MVETHIFKGEVDITRRVLFTPVHEHACGYSVEMIEDEGRVIGRRESGLIVELAPGYTAKLLAVS